MVQGSPLEDAPFVHPNLNSDASVIDSGSAGASALREYERRKNKREARIREAHPHIGGFLLAISDDPQSTKAWATGAAGEMALGRRLDGLVNESTFALHDRRIPPTKANIDHIVVSSSGVFVIDAKKYKGRPSLRVEGGFLRPRVEKLMVGSRDQTKLVDGVRGQVAKVRAALAAANLSAVPVSGMLCFVEAEWPLIGGDFSISGIRVVWPKKAAAEIAKPGPLDSEVTRRVRHALAEAFPVA
ncbi:MAG TPA: nuclease-related domain-containing protein [Diaminobutyricibacter sp.]